ncbi:MAG: DUF333 domain-containing protein [Candidatus Zixiibacteriota bacterium]
MRKLICSSVTCLILIILILFFINCQKKTAIETEKISELQNLYAGVPNPSSVYCQELGYKGEIKTDTSGNQYELCIFPDGSECRSWDFLKGKCGQKFTLCEKQGARIESRVQDMGTWKMEYAVCVFPNGSERPEWKLLQEKLKKEQEE